MPHSKMKRLERFCAALSRSGDPACSFVLGTLRAGSRADVERLIPKLPVYPAVATRILNMLAKDDVGAPELEQLAKSDGVLAGNLLKVAKLRIL